MWESEESHVGPMPEFVAALADAHHARGVYHKSRFRHVRGKDTESSSPRLVAGDPAPDRFEIRENGASFELSFNEGYSYGLFLDQRENRRRLLQREFCDGLDNLDDDKDSPVLLNTFSYTCGFSVCAAKSGFTVISLDLSRKYLDWGRRNFERNEIDPDAHDFIYGDAFDWCRRLAKKGRRFDVIILDPPTFSKSKKGVFRAEKDYGDLVRAVVPMLVRRGLILASTNAARLTRHEFEAALGVAVRECGREIVHEEFIGQPFDFPVSLDEPAYLKTVWMRLN